MVVVKEELPFPCSWNKTSIHILKSLIKYHPLHVTRPGSGGLGPKQRGTNCIPAMAGAARGGYFQMHEGGLMPV